MGSLVFRSLFGELTDQESSEIFSDVGNVELALVPSPISSLQGRIVRLAIFSNAFGNYFLARE